MLNDFYKPAFLITIDTEGDNLWSIPKKVTTENAHYLPRFQTLCEKYGLKPTWLTNYEMALCPTFVELGRDVLNRVTGEIGMHLHAWDSPPITNDSLKNQTYLIEYPVNVMKDKIKFMTELLENQFEHKVVSHRAGRWAFNSCYAHLLAEHGYQIDCSVTPYVSWKHTLGDPNGNGGTDYTSFPSKPYFLDLDRIDCEGDSSLLEVPVSILLESDEPRKTLWLRPNGYNIDSMLAIVEQAYKEKWLCVEFMLHSSELMPGGSPTFQTGESIEKLYNDLEILFRHASHQFQGRTLCEFYNEYKILRNTLIPIKT